MLYLILTLSLTLLGVLAFLPRFQKVLRRFSTGINFFLTLIATLVGVLLAITITNYEAEQKEKQDLIKLLQSAVTVVETSYKYGDELLKYYNTLNDKDDEKKDFYVNNPLPYPDYLDILLTQSLASKNLSLAVLSGLNVQVINLKKIKQSRKYVPLYLNTLNQTRDILTLEIHSQQGSINNEQLQLKLKRILIEPM